MVEGGRFDAIALNERAEHVPALNGESARLALLLIESLQERFDHRHGERLAQQPGVQSEFELNRATPHPEDALFGRRRRRRGGERPGGRGGCAGWGGW